MWVSVMGFNLSKKTSILFLRLFVSVSLILLILQKIDFETFFQTIKSVNVPILFSGVLISILGMCVASYRWCRIIRHTAINTISTFSCVKIYFIGLFYNTILPSSIGGDISKWYYLSVKTSKKKLSFLSVISDRMIGLMSLIFIFFCSALGIRILLPDYNLRLIKLIEKIELWIILFLVCLGVSLYIIKILGDRTGIKKGVKENNYLSRVIGIYDLLQALATNRGLVIFSFLLSLLSHFLIILSSFIISRSIQIDLGFLYFLLFIPIIIFVTLLPISIGGLGVRESGYVLLFSQVGLDANFAISLSFLVFFSNILRGLLGGFFLLYNSKRM